MVFPTIWFLDKKTTCIKRALLRIFNDLTVDLARFGCSHIPAIFLTSFLSRIGFLSILATVLVCVFPVSCQRR